MSDTETYILLKDHEDAGVLKKAGASVALSKEQWHLLHMHDVVGDSPDPVAQVVE